MPFLYELRLDPREPEYTLVQQLVPAGTLVGMGQAVAVLSDGAMEFHLPAPRQGLLVAWHVASGMHVRASDPIARLVCEGAARDVPDSVPVRLG